MEEKVIKLKKELKRRGVRGLALDIDETLSYTNTHWFEYMINFYQPETLTKEEIIAKYQFVEEVPDWQTEEARKYMEETLHSNDFNETIPLIENADKAVRDINKIIPIVAYITARPATVIEGTLKWFEKHNFPKAELITRPSKISLEDFNANKNRWKARVLEFLYPEVMGIVDDNKILANELEAIKYKGKLYLYGGEGKEFKNHDNLIVCPTWQDVLKAIVK